MAVTLSTQQIFTVLLFLIPSFIFAQNNAALAEKANDAGHSLYQVTNVIDRISALPTAQAIPTFMQMVSENSPNYPTYLNNLELGIFSDAESVGGVQYHVGLAASEGYNYDNTENHDHTENTKVLYLLIDNPSDQDKTVTATFQIFKADGSKWTKPIERRNSFVLANSDNHVIGLTLPEHRDMADTVHIQVTVDDIDDSEPETALYRRAMLKTENFNHSDFSVPHALINFTNKELGTLVGAIFDQNLSELVFDETTASACENRYRPSVVRYWSEDINGQYLLYTADCTTWSGGGLLGHQRQVLYKMDAQSKSIRSVATFTGTTGMFEIIESINDINHDGAIELVISRREFLDSQSFVYKLIDRELVLLIEGGVHSEGGYYRSPVFKANPFVIAE